MTDEEIIDMADRAARSVRKKYDLNWSYDDFQDARQEAALGIVRAWNTHPNQGAGYYFNAGHQGATRYAFRRYSVHTDSITRDDGTDRDDGSAIESVDRAWSVRIDDETIPLLRRALNYVARKVGARGGPKSRDQLAVARDIILLQELSEGRTQQQVAELMGIGRTDVGAYRRSIRQRLAAFIANEKGE